MGDRKKVVFIAGPLTGDRYWEEFEKAEDDITALGYIPLSPSRLPEGLSRAQATRIHAAMIDSADAVLFLPGWGVCDACKLARDYCERIGKPAVFCLTCGMDNKTRYARTSQHLREVLG